VRLKIRKRADQAQGFGLLPKRGVVARPFGWVGTYRRLSKDDAYRTANSEAMIYAAMVLHILGRRIEAKTLF
jgi:putative transposase